MPTGVDSAALTRREHEIAGAVTLEDLAGSLLDELQRLTQASGAFVFVFEQPLMPRALGGSLAPALQYYFLKGVWPAGLRYGERGMFAFVLTEPTLNERFDAAACRVIHHVELPLKAAARRIRRLSEMTQERDVLRQLLGSNRGARSRSRTRSYDSRGSLHEQKLTSGTCLSEQSWRGWPPSQRAS